MSQIPAFPYEYLWEERVIRSVANLTRQDGVEFFELLSRVRVKTEIQTFPLEEANLALTSLRKGSLKGAGVLIPPDR
jgi:alcohol dehydrogenase, propanol-preferring